MTRSYILALAQKEREEAATRAYIAKKAAALRAANLNSKK